MPQRATDELLQSSPIDYNNAIGSFCLKVNGDNRNAHRKSENCFL